MAAETAIQSRPIGFPSEKHHMQRPNFTTISGLLAVLSESSGTQYQNRGPRLLGRILLLNVEPIH